MNDDRAIVRAHLEDWGHIRSGGEGRRGGRSQSRFTYQPAKAGKAMLRSLDLDLAMKKAEIPLCVLGYWEARYILCNVSSLTGYIKLVFGEIGRREMQLMEHIYASKIEKAEAKLAELLGE